MRENVLEGLAGLVTTAMFVVLGILAALCLFLILRAGALPTVPSFRRRRKKSKQQVEEDNKRRRRMRLWFWDRS